MTELNNQFFMNEKKGVFLKMLKSIFSNDSAPCPAQWTRSIFGSPFQETFSTETVSTVDQTRVKHGMIVHTNGTFKIFFGFFLGKAFHDLFEWVRYPRDHYCRWSKSLDSPLCSVDPLTLPDLCGLEGKCQLSEFFSHVLDFSFESFSINHKTYDMEIGGGYPNVWLGFSPDRFHFVSKDIRTDV